MRELLFYGVVVVVVSDFSDAIANLTLIEHPNSLYNDHRSWHDHYEDQSYESSESEEVDSDSGYSSPLHRRNLNTTTTNAPSAPTDSTSASKPLPHHPPNGLRLMNPATVLSPHQQRLGAPQETKFQFPPGSAPAVRPNFQPGPVPFIRPNMALTTYPVSQYSAMPMYQSPPVGATAPFVGAQPNNQYSIPGKPNQLWIPPAAAKDSKLNADAVEFTFSGSATMPATGGATGSDTSLQPYSLDNYHEFPDLGNVSQAGELQPDTSNTQVCRLWKNKYESIFTKSV